MSVSEYKTMESDKGFLVRYRYVENVLIVNRNDLFFCFHEGDMECIEDLVNKEIKNGFSVSFDRLLESVNGDFEFIQDALTIKTIEEFRDFLDMAKSAVISQ